MQSSNKQIEGLIPREHPRLLDEEGNAQVEFIGVVAALIIPLVYAIVSFSQIQAAQYAVTSSAHAIARASALHQNTEQLELIARLALRDQGFDTNSETLTVQVECSRGCAPDQPVFSRVDYALALPGLGWTGTKQVKVSARGTSYRGVLQSDDG